MLVFGYLLHHYFANENLLATVLSMRIKSMAKPAASCCYEYIQIIVG